jgi:hypothetical protein
MTPTLWSRRSTRTTVQCITSDGHAAHRALGHGRDGELTPPSRVVISTCVGCGAMSLPGSCAGASSEERKLELVPAADYDALKDVRAGIDAENAMMAAATNRLLDDIVARGRDRDAYRSAGAEARAVLRGVGAAPPTDVGRDTEPVVSWWCARCGGIDAPQPCIDVCIHRPAEWVNADVSRAEHEAAVACAAVHERLRGVLRLLAFTAPRDGTEPRHWEALCSQAARALGGCRNLPRPTRWRQPRRLRLRPSASGRTVAP